MAETKEIKCTCTHEYQDKTYGKGIRVANVKRGNEKSKGGAYCTVCGREEKK